MWRIDEPFFGWKKRIAWLIAAPLAGGVVIWTAVASVAFLLGVIAATKWIIVTSWRYLVG